MVFEPNAAYRNVHCAICHQADLKKLICLNLGPYGRFNWQQNFNSVSFAVLFDIGGNQGSEVGLERKCGEGELYDPFFKKCRNVMCAMDYHVVVDGECVDPNPPSSTTTTSTTTTTTTTTTSISTTTVWSSEEDSTEILVEEVDEPVEGQDVIVIEISSSSPATQSVNPAFISCPKFELQPDEFVVSENGSYLYVPVYDKGFNLMEFEILEEKGSAVICATEGVVFHTKYSAVWGYITLVCLIVSCICCILHLLASLITPELKNLNGKNLFSLTLALLGGYCSFIAAMFVTPESSTTGCFVLAAFMYFFFMASFMWMLVIALDVYRALKVATTQLR